MDGSAFDKLVRLVGEGRTRRRLLKFGLVPALGGLGLVSMLSRDEAVGKKKKKRKKCKKAGSPCTKNKQCCPGKTKRICDIETGDSGGDKECCGANGAKCGGVNEDGDALPPFCCIGSAGVNEFECSENDPGNPNTPGTCIPVVS